jgi:hypothetical protein
MCAFASGDMIDKILWITEDSYLDACFLHGNQRPRADAGMFQREACRRINRSMQNCRPGLVGLPSGPILSQFLQGSPLLQVLEFRGFDFKEEHCHTLARLQRRDLTVKLNRCLLDPQDAEGAFIEWFRHNQIVAQLECCDLETSILCALIVKNSVKRLMIETIQVVLARLRRSFPGFVR